MDNNKVTDELLVSNNDLLNINEEEIIYKNELP